MKALRLISNGALFVKFTRKLVRPSPYELVPKFSQYKFNNLFIIYPLNIHFTIDNA